MQYTDYDLEDFLEDNYFNEWVFNPSHNSCEFWDHFLESHPEKADVISTAKSVLLSFSTEVNDRFPQHDQVAAMWKKISVNLSPQVPMHRPLGTRPLAVAASLLMILCATIYLLRLERNTPPVTYTSLVTKALDELIEKKNLTNKRIIIHLPDHSKVTLEPSSSISYPSNFNLKTSREVYLLGQAFFEIEPDVTRPFFVYANELVTRVLGTSFTIKAFEHEQQMEVIVKTGRVSVFTRNGEDNLDTPKDETILTPNHRVLYSRKEEIMKKYLVDAPEIIACRAVSPSISNFEDARVSDILKNIEESYGVVINYDEHLFQNCLLTASFSNESLYDKVALICKGIEAEFAIVNAEIIVTGKGCN